MGDYSEEEEGSYDSRPYDSDQEELNHEWSDEESTNLWEEGDDHGSMSWSRASDSEISYEGELEREEEKPWTEEDYSSSEPEEETYEEGIDPKPPDCYRTCSNTLWCEEDSEEDSYKEYNPPKRAENPISYGVVSYRVPAQPRPTGPRKQVNKRSGYMSNSLVFSGSSKNPEVYLRWERNMKQWLCANNVPKDKKLSYAVTALVGDAYAWWMKEDTHTFRPVLDWGDLKARMYREFVKKNQTRSHISVKPIQHMTPRIVMTTPRLHTSPPEQHNTQRCPQVATHTPSSTPNRELQEKPQSKTSIALNSSAPVCYRCHKRGHFAATCPERQVVNVTTLEPKPSSSNSSDCLAQSGFEISNSSIMCLSSPRVNDAGLNQVMEHTVRKEGPEKVEVSPSFILMPEEPPDHTFTQYDMASKETKLIESFGQVSVSLLQLISDDSKSVMTDLLSLEELDENVGSPRKHLIQNNCFTTQLKPEQKSILNKTCLPVYNNSMTVLIHLTFAKGVGNIAGTKEEPPDLEIQDHVRGRVEPMKPPAVSHKQSLSSNLGPHDKVDNTGPNMEYEAKENTRGLELMKKPSETTSQLLVSDIYELIDYCQTVIFTRSLKHDVLSPYVPSEITNLLSLGKFDNNSIASMRFMNQNVCLNTQIEHEQRFYQMETFFPVYSYSMTVLMHLIFAKGVRYIAGFKEEPPDQLQGKYQRKFQATTLHTLETKEALDQYLFKEKPPDFKKMPNAPSDTKSSWTRGMTLNSQRRMKANLLSLSADYTVLRSKLLQEGGYDEVIKPSTNHGRDHMEQRQADETEESKSTQQGPNQSQVKKEIEPRTNIGVPQVMMRGIKTSSRTVLFFLHCGFIPMGFPGKVLTRQQLVGAQEPKDNCSSSTTTWITFSSHLVSTSKWNQPIISSDEGGIDFTSQLNSNIPDLDRCTLKGGFRPDQDEPRNEETCYGILTHQRSSGNWISTKPISDEQVIQFLNRNTLNLPYMESCGFGSLQSHIWRPGDILNQPETLQYSSTSAKTQSIIWIISRIKLLYARPELPYSEPCEFNSQGIFPQLSRHEFKADSMHLDVPRHHSFAPKLSRIKKSHNLPHLDDSLFIAPTALFI